MEEWQSEHSHQASLDKCQVGPTVWFRDLEANKISRNKLQVVIDKHKTYYSHQKVRLNFKWRTSTKIKTRPHHKEPPSKKMKLGGSYTPQKSRAYPKTNIRLEPTGQKIERVAPNSWIRTLQAELKDNTMAWNEAKRAAQDKSQWRPVVQALCSSLNEEV